jgi:ABC-type branched-subunit amino acid transport system substrate-binding protein
MIRILGIALMLAATSAGLPACERDSSGPGRTGGTGDEAAPLTVDRWVDPEARVIRVGALNDESGPAAAIGRPFAAGKRLLAAHVNAGGSGLLPEGWRLELVERDHAYNPQQSVAAFNEIKDAILFIGTSFGTPNTLPLRPMLQREGVVAFPASLSSELAEHPLTPPVGPSYRVEASRAMDWVVEAAGGPSAVRAGLVYQRDDYGQDGLEGWRAAAAHHGVALVSEQTVAPGQTDMTAVVQALKDAEATHVLLTTLPSATGPLLGTAAQLQYMPIWVGNTPAWVDRFFDPSVIPSAVFGRYHQMSGLPYWGEELPGMDAFLAAWERHGQGLGAPDFYILVSYLQGLVQLEAVRRALDAGDLTRAGYHRALTSIQDFDAGGLLQPIDLTRQPYVTATRTRVLRPDFERRSWQEVAPYADPAAPTP